MTEAAPDAGVGLWLARESLADDARVTARIAALLSDDERDRQARFGAPTPRRLDLVARGVVRTVLSRLEPGVAPRDWRFVRSDAGRPSLAPPFDATGLHFSVAHTPGLVVVAAGRVPRIGVDVEALDGRARLDVARRYFSGPEADALFALPPEARALRFLRLWTLKEAFLKATGEGVSGGLARATFRFDDDDLTEFRGDGADAADWAFHECRPPGYLVALAHPRLSVASAPPVTWVAPGAAGF
jgi:4'-phosphopantetheinyl transferase